MKLEKQEIQKIVLGGLLFAALIYSYFGVFLAGLAKSEKGAKVRIGILRPQIDGANKEIALLKNLKAKVPAATGFMDAVAGLIPEGAPIAWFPPRITEFMKRHGMDRCTTRLMSEVPERDLPGYKRLFWAVELPQVEFIPLCIAIAGLENEEPLIEITNVQVEATRNDPQFQRVLLTVSNIVRE